MTCSTHLSNVELNGNISGTGAELEGGTISRKATKPTVAALTTPPTSGMG